MGADMALAALPAAEMTDERLGRLHELIDGLSDEELAECGLDGTRDPRALLQRHADLFAASPDSREVVELLLPSAPYPLVFTGGMSWGDPPTDLYETFRALAECGPIVRQLQAWAIEDAGPMVNTPVPSTDSGQTAEPP